MAQSFMAVATTSAVDGSRGSPRSRVASNDVAPALGSRASTTERLNTLTPNWAPGASPLGHHPARGTAAVTASIACTRAALPLKPTPRVGGTDPRGARRGEL